MPAVDHPTVDVEHVRLVRVGRDVVDDHPDVAAIDDLDQVRFGDTAAYRIPVARLDAMKGPTEPEAVTATATSNTGLTLVLRLEVFPETGWRITRVAPVDSATGI